MRQILFMALAAIDVITALYFVQYGPFPLFIKEIGAPSAYLNIYIHVPAAVAIYIAATLALAFAVWGIFKRSQRAISLLDFLAYAVAILSWYAFISGTIWAAENWGSPFALDPRQMSILVLALMFSIYPAIRRSVEDPDRSAKLAQAYVVAGYALALLSLYAPVIAPEAFHPAPGITMEGPYGKYMGIRILLVTALLLLLMFIKPSRTAGYIYLAGAVVAAILLYPWLLYHPLRVINVTQTGFTLEDGRFIAINPQSVLSPAFYNGTPTLKGNFVVLHDGSASLARHWSAYVNAVLYFLFIYILMAVKRKI